MAAQKFIGLAKRPASEESSERREGTWMRRLQDQMLRIIQHDLLALCWASPQYEYDRSVLAVQGHDCCIREFLPSDTAMGICLMGANRKYGIQHQDSLLCPLCQTAMAGDSASQIVMQFLVYVDQGRRDFHAFFYGKAEAVGLPVIVVGILPQNYHFDILQRSQMKCIKNIICRRKYLPGSVLLIYCLK